MELNCSELPHIFNPSDYASECEKQGPAGMGFLFKKVDGSILDPVDGYPCFLVDCCLSRCLDESQSTSQITHSVILCSTTIKRIMTIIQEKCYPLTQECQQRVLDYVFRSWDVVMEVVCYEAVDIFNMLLNNHCLSCSKCKSRIGCEWSDSIAKQLFEGVSACRSRYKCILHLLKSYSTYLRNIDTAFIKNVYSHIGNASLSIVLSDIISFDLMGFRDRWDIHVEHIQSCLSSDSVEKRCAVKDRLLPSLTRTKLLKDEFLPLVLENIKGRPLHMHCLDSILSITRFLIISNKKCDSYRYWYDYIPLKAMQYAVLHCKVQVRLAVWLLLSEHPQLSHALNQDDIDLIRAFLLTNMTEQSPAIRQKVLAGLRKILARMAETSEQVLKGRDRDVDRVKRYNDFVNFLLSLAFDSISPEANFGRRLMALSIIQCLFTEDSLKPNNKSLFLGQLNLPSAITSKRLAALVSCLDDSFQLCQIMALEILRKINVDNFDFDAFMDETIEMMKSIRSHNTLAAGYRLQFYIMRNGRSLKQLLTQFVSICEENVEATKENLIVITKQALHPWLNTIALLLEYESFEKMSGTDIDWWIKFVCDRLLPLCFEVAEVVTPAVHSMSPEGYIPEETLSEMANVCSLGSKVQIAAEMSQILLVCCWRAHKHVSAILAWAVVKLCPLDFLTPDIVQKIGGYYWLQLTECKHCGAFESAVDGFTAICTYLWSVSDPALPKPSVWLHQILDALEGKKDLHNLCSTRRSAGVPHLVATILSTEPASHDSRCLNLTFTSLLEMENKELEYRVHSLNVLKAIISSSALGESVTPGLEWACQVAISGCSASEWSERNAAAQLVAALRARIFGVTHKSQRDLYVDQKNRQSSYEFFSKFPTLYSYLYDELRNCRDEFSMYPTLIFLTHLFPSHADEIAIAKTSEDNKEIHNYPLAPFVPALIQVLLWSRAEKLRRLSAAAIVAISRPKDISFVLDWIVGINLKNIVQNHVNAVLLLLTLILENDSRNKASDKIRKYVAGVIDGGFWMRWCDLNKDLIMILCNNLGLPFSTSENIDGLTLAKRPLAYAIISNGNLSDVQILVDLELRQEIYRHLQIAGTKNEIFKSLLTKAIEDLLQCSSERDAACILDLLYLNREYCCDEEKKKIAAIISDKLADGWRMPDTVSLARRLFARISEDKRVSPELLKWIKSCLEVEHELSKRLALDVGAYLLEKDCDLRLVRIMAAYLQDESLQIREEAALVLSKSVLNTDKNLNPDVCYRLITEIVPEPELSPQRSGQDVYSNGDLLYDACSINAYAESHMFGDFGEVRKMVDELLTA